MQIIIRLVGYSETVDDNKYAYEYSCEVNTIFNFEILKIIFNKYNDIISEEELNNCTLTCNSKNLKKDCLIDSNTFINTDITYKVFIFTVNNEIKNKLISIFKMDGYRIAINNISSHPPPNNDSDSDSVNSTIKEFNKFVKEINESKKDNDSNSDSSEDEETAKKILAELNKIDSDDESDKILVEDVEPSEIKQNLDLLMDADFITLIRIYKNRGDLFNDFYKYINSSQIIKFSKLENETELINNLNFIKELNLDFPEDKIIESLKQTGNHINLAIRYLLYNQ
jgi:hypothetical protein